MVDHKNMPDQVPYLDENGHKRYMKSETYIRNELEKELKVRDDIAEKLADKSEAGLIPKFIKAVNGEQVVDANEMPLDNSTNAEYNEDDSLLYVPKKKDTRYINVNQSTLLAIKTALRDVYGGIDGIADKVAVR